jgi:hypothetical protein
MSAKKYLHQLTFTDPAHPLYRNESGCPNYLSNTIKWGKDILDWRVYENWMTPQQRKAYLEDPDPDNSNYWIGEPPDIQSFDEWCSTLKKQKKSRLEYERWKRMKQTELCSLPEKKPRRP